MTPSARPLRDVGEASGRGCAGRAGTRAGTPFSFALALGAAARAQPACASAQARNGQNPVRQTAVPRVVSSRIRRSFATPHFQRSDPRLTTTHAAVMDPPLFDPPLKHPPPALAQARKGRDQQSVKSGIHGARRTALSC